MPNTSISFPASPTAGQTYTYGSTTYTFDGSYWSVNGSSVDQVSTNDIQNDAITTTKILNGAVTPAKLSTGGPSWTSGGNLTITGDLTVDTNTLFVDATNNRIGVGTITPTQALDISGNANISGNLVVDTNTLVIDSANNRVGIGTASPAVTVDVVGEVRAQSGLLLGATSGASRTLDYYESGSWTPTWTGGMTVTGGSVSGRFVRIGKFAHVSLIVENVTIANPSAGSHGGLPSHLIPAGGRSSSLIAHYIGFSIRDPLFYIGPGNNFQFLQNQASDIWTSATPLAGSGIYMVINHSFIVA
jgi:hypothetical protein